MRSHELLERLAAHALDGDGGQVVAGVAVEPLRAGGEVEGALPAHHVQHVRVRVHARAAGPARRLHHRAPVAQARGVVEHLPQRHGGARLRQLRQPGAHGRVQRQLALLREEQGRRGGELLGDGARLEDRLRRVGHTELQVGHAVAAREHHLPALRHAYRAPRPVRPTPGGEDRVHLCCAGGGLRPGCGGRGGGGLRPGGGREEDEDQQEVHEASGHGLGRGGKGGRPGEDTPGPTGMGSRRRPPPHRGARPGARGFRTAGVFRARGRQAAPGRARCALMRSRAHPAGRAPRVAALAA